MKNNKFKKNYLICVTGASGSGKTTILTNLIKLIKKEGFKSYALIRIDNYYHPNDNIPEKERANINFDHPNSIDFKLLTQHLKKLILKNEAIDMPIYDFTRHTRFKNKVEHIKPANVILLEGIFGLQDKNIRKLMNLGIYVDTDLDLCLARRIVRDINDRGRTLESVIKQYTEMTKPMFEKFIQPTKKYANLIIPEGGHNKIAINVLFSSLKTILH